MKDKIQNQEKLPNIYSSTNSNNNSKTNQSILRRNEIIDEYIESMDKKENGLNEISLTSEEDDKDPFSSKAIKNLKPIKKEINKLILPNFIKREKLKSESSSRKKNFKENFNNNKINQDNENKANNISEKNFLNKIIKNKNSSENNIYENSNSYLGNFLINNNANNKLNSKWTLSSNTYNNYINYANHKILNKNKNKFKINNNNLNKIDTKGRSRSHIGNKPSYNLYNTEKNNYLFSNNSNVNTPNRKYTSTQVDINKNIYAKNYKRNFTAKILKNNKISILENNKQNKKYGKHRVYSTMNTRRIVENKHQIYEKLINEKNNPYGLGWINKMLGKNNEEKVGLAKGFINGVPVVKILSRGELTKKELKKKLSEIERKKKEEESKMNKIVKAEAKLKEGELDDEYNIPKEILEQFNKNSKNFFKARKDIIEQPEEEEEQAIEK